MPQFDFYSFASQNFWFLLTFILFYFIVVYLYLPSFSEVLKMRQKLIFLSLNFTKPSNLWCFFLKNFFKN